MTERLPRRLLLFVLALLLCVLAIGAALGPDPKPAANAALPPFTPPAPPAKEVAAGRRLYLSPGAELGCATCHGRNAEGSRLGPALVGVVDEYYPLLGRDPAKVKERLVNHMIDPDEYPALGSSKPGSRDYIAPMPPYAKLSREDLEALAAYLMSLTAE